MITRVQIHNFKSIAEADLKLGAVNMLCGDSGTGKTNVVEALRAAAGLATGLTPADALGAGSERIRARQGEAIRGGPRNAARRAAGTSEEAVRISITGQSTLIADPANAEPFDWRLDFEIDPKGEQLLEDRLTTDRIVYERGASPKVTEKKLERRSALTHVTRSLVPDGYRGNADDVVRTKHRDCALAITKELGGLQYIALDDRMLRSERARMQGHVLEPSGGNLITMIEEILSTNSGRAAYASWLVTASEEDVREPDTYRDDDGYAHLLARINGCVIESPSWSGGLLRMAALTSAFFQKERSGLLLIDDIDNGMSRRSLKGVSELLYTQRWADHYLHRQVLATARQPGALDWAERENYANVYLTGHDGGNGKSKFESVAALGARTGYSPASGELGMKLQDGWRPHAPQTEQPDDDAGATGH